MRADVSITSRPIQVEKVIRSVLCPPAGGTAVFIGTVRGRSGKMKVDRMVIESAEDIAVRDLIRITDEAKARFNTSRIAVRHRVGEMIVGDVIVVIAVSAPHRAEAFSACKYIIDRLKKSTPIWKKEIGGGSQKWVEPER